MEEVWRTDWCRARAKYEGNRGLLQLPRQEGAAAEHGGKGGDRELSRRQTQQREGERRVGLQGSGLGAQGEQRGLP